MTSSNYSFILWTIAQPYCLFVYSSTIEKLFPISSHPLKAKKYQPCRLLPCFVLKQNRLRCSHVYLALQLCLSAKSCIPWPKQGNRAYPVQTVWQHRKNYYGIAVSSHIQDECLLEWHLSVWGARKNTAEYSAGDCFAVRGAWFVWVVGLSFQIWDAKCNNSVTTDINQLLCY